MENKHEWGKLPFNIYHNLKALSYLLALNDEYFSDVRRLRMYDGTRYSFSLTTYFRCITANLKETNKGVVL